MAPSSVTLCFAILTLIHTLHNVHSVRVPASPLLLSYHSGPLLSGPQPIKLCITFYGSFPPSQRLLLKAFLSSLNPSPPADHRSLLKLSIDAVSTPSVAKWWSLTQLYLDSQGRHVSQRVELVGERDDAYSLGKHLRASDIANLARSCAELLPVEDANRLVLIFTSADVYVEGFCMHACGSHAFIPTGEFVEKPSREGGSGMLPYAWVGNSEVQCPGLCAWPFAKPAYGPPMEPLKAPNGVGIDGMIMALAKVIAGAATNPFGDAFYLGGDATFGLEASGVCVGKFGAGAYPGFPGELLQDVDTGASYNMEGNDGIKFLVPWMWNPALQACAGQA
eukprot:c16038_g1_i1 orf=86-1090(+)